MNHFSSSFTTQQMKNVEDIFEKHILKLIHFTLCKKNLSHQSITLKPISNNPNYQEFELAEEELIGLKVIGTFECVLG